MLVRFTRKKLCAAKCIATAASGFSNTLLGAASRLAESFPRSEVRAFALVRTLGLQPEIERILEPCVGRIRATAQEADREP